MMVPTTISFVKTMCDGLLASTDRATSAHVWNVLSKSRIPDSQSTRLEMKFV